ncbi:MAG: undecaprenyl/decaprenyl-phosphate alpha-N-acetylglucosaminyl 1-phosphate transferase [Deltaproteobacteria bacterium]|nr:undecaprenyl/decaprenyl-phosphate alpha-N-acetylglucosaminyl 1-phosphate transferase [Deltaproteobacteria bacterium]
MNPTKKNAGYGRWLFLQVTVFVFLCLLLAPKVRCEFTEAGLRWLFMLVFSFSVAFCLTPVFAAIARKFNIMDMPDARKAHSEATPLLGGGAVFLALIGAVALNGIWAPGISRILAGSAILFIVGAADDIREVRVRYKMAAQFLAAVFVMSGGIVLRVLPDCYGIFSIMGNWVLTMTWIIGITNAMNFFDGMDGLAAGLGAMIAFFLGVIALQTDQPFLGWISVAVMGSCLGFLPHNLKARGRASIFLGDGGSTVIGFVLACIAVYGKWAEHNAVVALVSPLLIFWVLVFDMVYITVDRIYAGKVATVREWLEYVGRDHLHHRLADVIGSKKKSVVFIYMMTACMGISALVLRNASPGDALLLVLQAVILVGLISVLERYGRQETRDKKQETRDRKQETRNKRQETG